jgi:hypothetical protein
MNSYVEYNLDQVMYFFFFYVEYDLNQVMELCSKIWLKHVIHSI